MPEERTVRALAMALQDGGVLLAGKSHQRRVALKPATTIPTSDGTSFFVEQLMNTAAAADPILAACPQCHSVVRVPAGRSDEHPKCPRCKSELFTGKPVALDKASFATYVERTNIPVLVDFWAPWCGPCRMMAPVLDRTAQERAATLQVAKINTDEQQELAARFGIRSIPTLILFRDGRELARQSGAVDGGALTRWLDSALAR